MVKSGLTHVEVNLTSRGVSFLIKTSPLGKKIKEMEGLYRYRFSCSRIEVQGSGSCSRSLYYYIGIQENNNNTVKKKLEVDDEDAAASHKPVFYSSPSVIILLFSSP